MPYLFRYRWLKLPRAALPEGKGLSAYWARLARQGRLSQRRRLLLRA